MGHVRLIAQPTGTHWLSVVQMVGGKLLTGPLLADLITKMVTALNSRDIPTVGSIMEFFNKEASPAP